MDTQRVAWPGTSALAVNVNIEVGTERGKPGGTTTRNGTLPNSTGFSLIELLVAIVLIAVGSLATMTMQRAAVKKNNLTDTRQTAAQLAREILETVRQTNYVSTNLNTTSGSFVTLSGVTRPGLIQGTTNPGNIFTRQLKIDDNTPINNVKQVQVRVTWDHSGVTQSLSLTTFKTK
jgi:prepilin-type N-terminal cleavage/methylation domain-containing protein